MKRNVSVTKIMTAEVTTVHLGQPLSEVRQAMQAGGFHHVPVVSGGKLIGILSSTDLLNVSYAYGEDARTTDAVLDHTVSIEKLMKEPVTVETSSTIRDATEILAEGQFHAIPVVDEAGKLEGLVTSTDILRYFLEQY